MGFKYHDNNYITGSLVIPTIKIYQSLINMQVSWLINLTTDIRDSVNQNIVLLQYPTTQNRN